MILEYTKEENIEIKLISESRVLLRVNPSSIFVVLYQRKMENMKKMKEYNLKY